MSFTPCKNCERRHEACHDACEEYQKYREQIETTKKRREKIRKIDLYYYDRIVEYKHKQIKKNKRRRLDYEQ